MDSRTARWMQIVSLWPDQIADIHRLEVSLGTRSGPLNLPLYLQNELPTWKAMGKIGQAIRSVFPDGYWPRGMDNSEQASSIEHFEREIYPIWMGILRRNSEKDQAMTQDQINAPGQVLFEVITMHKQDLAIRDSGIKPRRMGQAQEAIKEIRQKAGKAAGLL